MKEGRLLYVSLPKAHSRMQEGGRGEEVLHKRLFPNSTPTYFPRWLGMMGVRILQPQALNEKLWFWIFF